MSWEHKVVSAVSGTLCLAGTVKSTANALATATAMTAAKTTRVQASRRNSKHVQPDGYTNQTSTMNVTSGSLTEGQHQGVRGM